MAYKTNLKNTLGKLNHLMARVHAEERFACHQEALDLLMTMAGLKPVTMHGVGVSQQIWLEGVPEIARSAGLTVIEGRQWNVRLHSEAAADVPSWFTEILNDLADSSRAHYICRSRTAAREIADIGKTGAPTIAQEARLLNYPECCVEAHYVRRDRFCRFWYERLLDRAGGDEEEAARRFAQEKKLEPETPEEIETLEEIMSVRTVPYTSFNICDDCLASGQISPAGMKSHQAERLAQIVDRSLAQTLQPQGNWQ